MIKRYFCFGLLGALLLSVSPFTFAVTRPDSQVSEEFHQTYPISENGKITLENISGSVSIKGWDRNEVKVDAVKKAYNQDRLSDADIQVNADSSSVKIKTKYRSNNLTWNDQGYNRENNPPTVEYTLMVPMNARIDKVNVVNSSVDIDDLNGEVNASSVNGRVRASKLSGGISLSTVNGRLEVSFDQLSASQHIRLSSVNGTVVLALGSGANAEIDANTVHGGITNDFGWDVSRGEYVGHYMSGVLGSGGTRITLGNVNGSIAVRRGSGEPMIPPITVALRQSDNRVISTRDEGLSDHDREFLSRRRQTLENGRNVLDQKRAAIDQQKDALNNQQASLNAMRNEFARRKDVTIEERRVLDAERAVLDAEHTALDSVRMMLDRQRSALDDDLTVIRAQLDGNDGSSSPFIKSTKANRNKGR